MKTTTDELLNILKTTKNLSSYMQNQTENFTVSSTYWLSLPLSQKQTRQRTFIFIQS